jgi:hypothetical protein
VGDLELASVEGETVDATVYKGQIVAREVRGAAVRLRTTVGDIVFIGALRPNGRYELATLDGDVRLSLRPAPFRVEARAPTVSSRFPLVRGAAGLRAAGFPDGGATLRLTSERGEIELGPLAAADYGRFFPRFSAPSSPLFSSRSAMERRRSSAITEAACSSVSSLPVSE